MHHNRLHRLETDRRSPYSYKAAFHTGESRGTLDLGPSFLIYHPTGPDPPSQVAYLQLLS